MAESLVLRVSAPGAHLDGADAADWVVVDPSGVAAGPAGHGSIDDAALALGGRRLVLLLPGADVALASPEIPGRNPAKLIKLVPYALEEQLATDVDSLHFAIGRQGADGRLPVAATERLRLVELLRRLASVGLVPTAVYPDSLVVPENPAHVVVLIETGHVVVRRPGQLPLVLDADPLDAALGIAGLPPAPGTLDPAPDVIIYAAPAEWARHQGLVESLRDEIASLKVQLLTDGALPLLAAGAMTVPPFNLLQGDLAPRQGFGGNWSRWRLAALLAAAFLVLHVATLGVDWWRVHRDEQKVDQQLHAAAVEALPQVQNLARLPSVRLAVESRVHVIRAAVSEGLLGTLGALASGVAAAPGTLVQTLSYHDGATDLTVDAPDVASLDRLQEAAKGRGFSAQIQGAAQHEQRFEGRLQIKGAGR